MDQLHVTNQLLVKYLMNFSLALVQALLKDPQTNIVTPKLFGKQPLAYFCNLSFTQDVFPKELKLANVLPLYKLEEPYSFNNYRPVSLLCVLSKVFEKVIYDRLLEFLETHKLSLAGQFGFRKQHSSYMALMILIDKLISS